MKANPVRPTNEIPLDTEQTTTNFNCMRVGDGKIHEKRSWSKEDGFKKLDQGALCCWILELCDTPFEGYVLFGGGLDQS